MQQKCLDELLLSIYQEMELSDMEQIKSGNKSAYRLYLGKNFDIFGQHLQENISGKCIEKENAILCTKNIDCECTEHTDIIDYEYIENVEKPAKLSVPRYGDFLLGFYLPNKCLEEIDFEFNISGQFFNEIKLKPGQFIYAIDGCLPLSMISMQYRECSIQLKKGKNVGLTDIRLIYCNFGDNHNMRKILLGKPLIFELTQNKEMMIYKSYVYMLSEGEGKEIIKSRKFGQTDVNKDLSDDAFWIRKKMSHLIKNAH